MAHRFRLSLVPVLTAPARLGDGWRVTRTHWNELRRRWAVDPRLFAWQLLWLPFWLGGDRPAPSWPSGPRSADFPDRAQLAGAEGFFQLEMAALVRRFRMSWVAASLLRGVWLGLLIALGWMLLALVDVTSPPSLPAITVLAVLLACWGVACAVLNRPSAPMVASMVDRTFLLEERLTTAIDTIAPGGDVPGSPRTIPRLQLADAANALGEARHHLTRGRFVPVREIVGVLVVGMALLTAIFAYVPDRRLPGISQSPVPVFVPASQRLADPQVADRQPVSPPQVEAAAPTVAEVQEEARLSQATRDDLGTVGKALEDNPTTQPAADAIADGDYPAAANAIRSAASGASAMSPEGRNALAGELETAAERISEENPELAEASRAAAEDLRRGGEDAGAGLSDLGDEVEQAGANVTPPGELARDLDEAQAGAAAEPGAPSDGQGQQGAEAQGGEGQGQDAAGQSGSSADGALADPGEGVAAEPGVANPEQEGAQPGSAAGQQGGEAPGGQEQEGAGSAPEGTAGQPAQDPSGEGAASSGSASGESGAQASDASAPSGGPSQGLTGGPAEETDAAQGSGAGTGQTGANDRSEAQQGVDAPAPAEGPDRDVPVPGNGEASDRPLPGAGQPGDPGDSGAVSGGSSTLQLEGSSENGVRTGSDSGSSSLGSGSGASTASGDEVQGAVGVAGPDSNRVPEDRRDIVEDYFSGPEGAP